MSPAQRFWSLFLTGLVVLQPLLLTGCISRTPDKRILQYLNREGFGKRYAGNVEEENYVTIGDTFSWVDRLQDELRGTARVDVDGTIQLPEAGTVFVAGYTRSELESYLTQRLAPYWNEVDIQVALAAGTNRRYFVVGAVGNEGALPFSGNLTVFEAVLAAGPKQHGANLGRVQVIRPDPRNPIIIPVDVAAIWERGDSTTNIDILENDIIYIPPTLLQQAADFVAGLVTPFVSIFSTVLNVILRLEGNNVGRRRRTGGF